MEIVILLTLLALTHYLTFKAGHRAGWERCIAVLIAHGRANPEFWNQIRDAGR